MSKNIIHSTSMERFLPVKPAFPLISIVIPVYNEEDGLQALFDRLYPALDLMVKNLNVRYEVVFVNDTLFPVDIRVLFALRPIASTGVTWIVTEFDAISPVMSFTKSATA